MGSSLSSSATVQVCAAANQSVICPSSNSTPGNGFPSIGGFKSDPDIAGIGVCYAFVISAFITLGVASMLLLLDVLAIRTNGQQDWITKGGKILEAVILSFSDQQMVTGLSMVIAARFYLGCGISAYHYDIVCNLVLMSVVTHLCSITFITLYFQRVFLGIVRAVLILLTFIFAGFMFAERLNANFPTGTPSYGPTNSTHIPTLIAPAACFVSGNINITNQFTKDIVILEGSKHATGFTEYVILLVFTVVSFGLAAIYSFITPEKHPRTMWWLWWVRVPLLLAAWVIAISATLEFWPMRLWMNDSIWPADTAENDWTFGQFLPLLLMMLAGLTFIEAFYDHLEDPPKSQRYLPIKAGNKTRFRSRSRALNPLYIINSKSSEGDY